MQQFATKYGKVMDIATNWDKCHWRDTIFNPLIYNDVQNATYATPFFVNMK